jgi:hypothetical protein
MRGDKEIIRFMNQEQHIGAKILSDSAVNELGITTLKLTPYTKESIITPTPIPSADILIKIEESSMLARISRPMDTKIPICTDPKTSKNYHPKVNSTETLGYKCDNLITDRNKNVASLLTIKEKNSPIPGHCFYELDPYSNFWLCIR